MKRFYIFTTELGPFYICQGEEGRFHPMFNDESLGSYGSPEAAADHLAGGYTFISTDGIDPIALGVPRDLRAWTRARSEPIDNVWMRPNADLNVPQSRTLHL